MPTTIEGNKIKIHLEKNALPGYSLSLKQDERHKILSKLAKKLGWVNIVRKLNVLYIYNKNNHPETATKFKQDMKYIQQHFSPKFNMSNKKKSRESHKKRTKKKSSSRKSHKKKLQLRSPKKRARVPKKKSKLSKKRSINKRKIKKRLSRPKK